MKQMPRVICGVTRFTSPSRTTHVANPLTLEKTLSKPQHSYAEIPQTCSDLQRKRRQENIKTGPRHTVDWADLHIAATLGDEERVKKLLKKGVNPNARDEYGWTPLHKAAYWGHFDVVRLLIERGADLTDLHSAAAVGDVGA
jgi:ankyrin repeat protein